MTSQRIYKIRYNVERGEFTKEGNPGYGLTDSIMVVSVLHRDDGSSSTWYASLHSDGREFTAIEKFKVLAALAFALRDEGALPPWQHELCEAIHERVKNEIMSRRSQGEAN